MNSVSIFVINIAKFVINNKKWSFEEVIIEIYRIPN